MKRFFPLLLVLLVAACAPGPQEPLALEPVAPATETVPEEPSVVVVPAEPEVPASPSELPEVPASPPELPEVPAATEAAPADPEAPAAKGETDAPTSTPQGTIGVSADNQNFVTSSADEINPVTVTAGGTFYLQLNFTDPDGITAAQVELRNSADAGTLPTGPFTVAASDCETAVASAPTDLTCTLTVGLSPDAQNISEAGETAYAFRPLVSDALGNSELAYSWAYLIVEPQ